MKASHILIAHQDATFTDSARTVLEGEGWRVESATDGRKAFAKIRQLKPKIIILDLCAEAINALELIRSTRIEQLPTTVLVVPDVGKDEGVSQALQAGAYDVVSSPLQPENLLMTVRRSLERQDLLDELLAMRKALDGENGCIVGVSEQGVSLQAVERELLMRALDRFAGNQTRAARYLDISRRTLIYRMEKYKLRREFMEPSVAAYHPQA